MVRQLLHLHGGVGRRGGGGTQSKSYIEQATQLRPWAVSTGDGLWGGCCIVKLRTPVAVAVSARDGLWGGCVDVVRQLLHLRGVWRPSW